MKDSSMASSESANLETDRPWEGNMFFGEAFKVIHTIKPKRKKKKKNQEASTFDPFEPIKLSHKFKLKPPKVLRAILDFWS
jgi:hypothetical protein